jgi:hypothetical protein
MEPAARHLLVHATAMLLIGLLAGFPYARAIVTKKPESTVHAWRVAHASLAVAAALMAAVAAVLSSLLVAASVKWAIAGLLVVSAYGFALALVLGPIVSARGLSPRGGVSALLVFYANVLGVATSLSGTLFLLYAGFVSL